jgi:hypothetical protein
MWKMKSQNQTFGNWLEQAGKGCPCFNDQRHVRIHSLVSDVDRLMQVLSSGEPRKRNTPIFDLQVAVLLVEN